MALTIGGRRLGGNGPAQPLDPQEQRLADRVALALRSIQKVMDPEAYVQAIRALDPDLLERLLAEINVEGISRLLDDTLRGIVMSGSTAEARRIIRDTPRLQPPVGAGLEYGGQVLPSGIILPTSQTSPPPDIEFAIEQPVDRMFRVIDTRARDYAQFRSAALVREVTDSNRLAIRRVVAQAFTGPTPKTVDQTARTLRQVVGLHTRWANAVQRFDDENVARLIKGGMSVDEARARQDVLTKRYRDKLIRRRAEMIARTEIQTAQNYAREASWDALNRTGLVDGQSMKRWVTAPIASRYGPPCPECQEQAGKEVPWNGTFSNGRSMPPAHPHCRCTAVIVPPSRGLTGLPSQDLSSWLDRLDELEAQG